MFSNDANQMIASMEGDLPSSAIQALMSLFGSCSIGLSHQGPVEINAPGDQYDAINLNQIINNTATPPNVVEGDVNNVNNPQNNFAALLVQNPVGQLINPANNRPIIGNLLNPNLVVAHRDDVIELQGGYTLNAPGINRVGTLLADLTIVQDQVVPGVLHLNDVAHEGFQWQDIEVDSLSWDTTTCEFIVTTRRIKTLVADDDAATPSGIGSGGSSAGDGGSSPDGSLPAEIDAGGGYYYYGM